MSAGSTLSPPVAGSGNGTVGFTVASNGGSERTGSIIIAGQGSVVTQAAAAAPCTFTISPASQSIVAAGGAGTAVAVSTQAGCRWTAASNAAWITVTSGSNGTGNGSVGFTVGANTGASRTGTLTIGGRAFTVTQAAAGTAPPTPAPPTPAPPTPAPTAIFLQVLDFARRPECGGERGNAYRQSVDHRRMLVDSGQQCVVDHRDV